MKQAPPDKTPQPAPGPGSLLVHPLTGNILAVLAGLAFMLVCMLLPLVGAAGSAVPYDRSNFRAFLAALLVALLLSASAAASKWVLHRQVGGPRPYASLLLTGLCGVLLLALLTGLLSL